MEQKKRIIVRVSIGIVVIVAAIAIYFYVNPKNDTRPLPLKTELSLQKDLQSIVSSGKESDCDTLSDSRYRMGCHGFFANKIK